ncbi:MAG: prolyl oligopeptidase family serine peptidase [Mariniblastus sp.]
MNRIASLIVVATIISLFPSQTFAQKDVAKKKSADELTLKELFPQKSLFGPSARSTAFSDDGRYAAYLYRDYLNRRHGSDLWIYDFKTSKATQLTNIDMMSKFQRSARLVIADRLKKHKKTDEPKDDKKKAAKKTKSASKKSDTKNDAKKKDTKKSKEQLERERKIYMTVSDKDADDEYAPVYSGISSFKWHPENNSLLVNSEGDIYLVEDVSKPEMVRLTKTADRESQVDFLPDGSGYTYGSSDTVLQVKFGSHLIEQLNPRLGSGESLSDYQISHDGKRMVVVSRSGGRPSGAREVDIIRYRDRFAKSSKVPRTVSDDETKPTTVKVYLYDLEASDTEDAPLVQVFEETIDEPRDVLSDPKWSLDNQHLTFCFFDQKNSDVQIRLVSWPTEDEMAKAMNKAKTARATKEAKAATEAKKKDDENGTPGRSGPRGGRTAPPELVMHDSKVVYQFKHYGGPNTPRMVSPDFVGQTNHIVFVSEQSGFRHVHVLDPLYENLRQLTNGRFEVYPIRFSKDHKTMFVTTTKESAARQMVYSLDLESGDLERINKQDGNFSTVAVSNDGKHMLANYVTYGKLTELVAQSGASKVKTVTDSHPEKAKQLTKIKPEFFEYENRHGHSISGMMFKPKGWKKSKKHPLLIYVYGGPLGTRHSVNDGSYSSDGYFFQMYMAQNHGYVTVVVDPRGQSGYGGLFEKSNYEQVGKPQVEDLVDGVKHMTENYNTDDKRVGIYGWSFGGFQTQMCLYTEPEVFQVGMAGAGPTQWENYNSWYTTGTIGPSRTGKPDQEKYSLIPLAKNLKGQMLLVHGMEDTNVLFQDTVAVYRALLKAGKETNVELFLDPTGGHGLGGDVKRIGRMRKYEEFLLRTIGTGTPK